MIKNNTKLQKLKEAWDSLKVEMVKIKEEMSKVLEETNKSIEEQTNSDFGMSEFNIDSDGHLI
jgi:hypothetical protein